MAPTIANHTRITCGHSQNKVKQTHFGSTIQEDRGTVLLIRICRHCIVCACPHLSSVLACVRHLLGPDAVIRTYTVGMEGSTDIAFARKAAEHYRTEHHEALLTGTLQS